MNATRQITGKRSYLTGLAAEAGVVRHYLQAGLSIVARRWRGTLGEIDLIARAPDGYVFIEVKAARTLTQAAARLDPGQARRLAATAEEFLGRAAGRLDVPMRFDLALVDAQGRIDIHPNIRLAD